MARASFELVRGSGGRPVAPSNLHATLVFLGAVGEINMPAVMVAAEDLAAAPFEILFDRVEHWPRPQVLVTVPASPPPAATALAGDLSARLARGGLKIESRPWRPHVTLARKVTRPASRLTLAPVRWAVTGLSLVESLTGPAGVRYDVVHRWPLAAPGSPPDPPLPADCAPG
jgi:2'-5' RNA ligase